MIKSKVRTIDGTEDITAYTPEEVTLPDIQFKTRRRNKKSYLYAVEFGVFDSETSHDNTERGWVYQWSFMISYTYVYGRTPSDFIDLLRKIRDRYDLSDLKKMIVYVHNLS